MYDTYMYILANEGVATQDKYPFYGRVSETLYNYRELTAVTIRVFCSKGSASTIHPFMEPRSPVV